MGTGWLVSSSTTTDRADGAAHAAVIPLDRPEAADRRLSGAKAAALAEAARHGLPTVPGFVVSTAAVNARSAGAPLPGEVLAAWAELSQDGQLPLVVRSSSTVEDLGDSSMAGRFESVVGVRGRSEFTRAVDVVIGSRAGAADGSDSLSGDEPLAVLVQPLLEARCGGVLFGIDPVSGREDRLVVAVTAGGPDRLVSGEVDGSRYELDRSGRRVAHTPGDGGAPLSRRRLRELARLATRVQEVFDGPQDVEWAVDGVGRLRLLQSRPVTAEPRGRPAGPVFGPGPVIETFPEPLQPLEVDLWVEPLRSALRRALRLAGTATDDALDASPLVVVLDGWVAVDLDLLDPRHRKPRLAERLDPRPPLRRLYASWRVGRLRAALPALARDVIDAADETLSGTPALSGLSERQLVAVLRRLRPALVSVHAHELLTGLLVDPAKPGTTGAAAALRVLARGRQAGMADADVVAASPVVLALAPPQVRAAPLLPEDVGRGDGSPWEGAPVGNPGGDAEEGPPPAGGADVQEDPGLLREALRLRARWLQELGARAAWLLGERLAASGRLPRADAVREVHLDELTAAVHDPGTGLRPAPHEPGDPLPARFRVSNTGRPVAVAGAGGASGAGGGAGRGPVHQGDDPPEGAVLVVRTLDPVLAPVLPRLAGLVAETGSVLAHLAILAREAGVPTVVGYAGAEEKFSPGTVVRVDGDAGTVEPEEAS